MSSSIKADRQGYITSLSKTLGTLLPVSTESRILEFSTRVVDSAIAVGDVMIEESEIYRYHFPDRSYSFDQSHQVAEGEESTGKALLCTFPGLHRLNVKEDQNLFVTIVEARVVYRQTGRYISV